MVDVTATVTVRDTVTGLTSTRTVAVTQQDSSDPWAALDGRSAAPTGTINYPTLLNGYVARPPWKVAGVDYPVGVNAGITLTNAANVSQAGVSVDGGGKRLIISGANVLLQNVNFPAGWWLSVNGKGSTVRNCKFVGSSNGNEGAKVWCWPESGGGNFEYCDWDLQNGAGTYVARLYNQRAGGGTANSVYRWRYCRLLGAYADHLNCSGWDLALATGDTLDLKYNVLINNAQGPAGTHPDIFQAQNGYIKAQTLDFNTIVLNSVGTGTQGWGVPGSAQSASDYGRGQNLTWKNNTIVVTAGCSFVFSIPGGDVLGANTFSDNFYDVRGVTGGELFRIWPESPRPGGWSPLSGSISGTGNTNMVTGSKTAWNGTIYTR